MRKDPDTQIRKIAETSVASDKAYRKLIRCCSAVARSVLPLWESRHPGDKRLRATVRGIELGRLDKSLRRALLRVDNKLTAPDRKPQYLPSATIVLVVVYFLYWLTKYRDGDARSNVAGNLINGAMTALTVREFDNDQEALGNYYFANMRGYTWKGRDGRKHTKRAARARAQKQIAAVLQRFY